MPLSPRLLCRYFLPILGGLLVSCARPSGDWNPSEGRRDRLSRMTAEERTALAPNELFQKVLEGDLGGVQQVLHSVPALLAKRNSVHGNTPLGLALELREREIATFLAEQLPLQQYRDLNSKGESYVFLAARAGYADLILHWADRYYNSHGSLQDWGFGELDQETTEGQKALHVAADRRTVEVLQTQYYRGTLEIPYWSFTLHTDHRGQTFLHTAAVDGRTDVLLWGAEQFCSPNSWQKEGGWWITRTVGTAASLGVKTVQTYVGDFGLYTDLLFNRRDEDGNTALHQALRSRNNQAVRALAHCPWLDYKLPNNEGNLPLQIALQMLPQNLEIIPPDQRESFDFLRTQTTLLRRWITPPSAYVNHRNREGQNSLHLAARLADPRIYELLSREGDIYAQDAKGNTPLDLFNQKQRRVRVYAH